MAPTLLGVVCVASLAAAAFQPSVFDTSLLPIERFGRNGAPAGSSENPERCTAIANGGETLYAGDIMNLHHWPGYTTGSEFPMPAGVFPSTQNDWRVLHPSSRAAVWDTRSLKSKAYGQAVPNLARMWGADGFCARADNATCEDCSAGGTLCARLYSHFGYDTAEYLAFLKTSYAGLTVQDKSVRADVHAEPSGDRVACSDIEFPPIGAGAGSGSGGALEPDSESESESESESGGALMRFFTDDALTVRITTTAIEVVVKPGLAPHIGNLSDVHFHWADDPSVQAQGDPSPEPEGMSREQIIAATSTDHAAACAAPVKNVDYSYLLGGTQKTLDFVDHNKMRIPPGVSPLPLHPASGIIMRDGMVRIITTPGGIRIKSNILATLGTLLDSDINEGYKTLCKNFRNLASFLKEPTADLCGQHYDANDVYDENSQNCYDYDTEAACVPASDCTFSTEADTCMPVGGVEYPLGINTQNFKAAYGEIYKLLFAAEQHSEDWAEDVVSGGTCKDHNYLTPSYHECEQYANEKGKTFTSSFQMGDTGSRCQSTASEVIYTTGTNADEELSCLGDGCVCKDPYTLQIDIDTEWIGDPQRFDAFMRAVMPSENIGGDGAYFKIPTRDGLFSTLMARKDDGSNTNTYISSEECLARDSADECSTPPVGMMIMPPECDWNDDHGVCQQHDIECAFPDQWDCEDVNVPIILCNPYRASSSGSDSDSGSDSGMPVWAIVLVAAGVGVPAVYLLYAFSQKRWPFGGEVSKGAYARIDGLLY